MCYNPCDRAEKYLPNQKGRLDPAAMRDAYVTEIWAFYRQTIAEKNPPLFFLYCIFVSKHLCC